MVNLKSDPKVLEAKAQAEKRGISKLNPSQSMFANQQKPSKQEFEEKSQQVEGKLSDRFERGHKLSKTLLNHLQNKELTENKGPLAKKTEQEFIQQLINFGAELNNDPQVEEDSTGSLALINSLLFCLFIQRDKINTLDHRLTKLETIMNERKSI